MQITGELIEQFLAGQCSPEETVLILDTLEQYPALLDQYIGKASWDESKQDMIVIPEEIQRRIHTNVLNATIKKKRPFIYKITRGWMAAAAACVAVALVSWFLYGKTAVDNRQPAGKDQGSTVTNKSLAASTDTIINNNAKAKMRILLSDGSVVWLSSRSTIRYQRVFAGQQRAIRLTGEGYFQVAKDKHKPFIVYSNGISTTALGTSFTIRAFNNSNLVKVNLYTGKVMVKKETSQAAQDTAVYLIPGDRLTINTINFNTTLTSAQTSSEKQQPLATPYPAVKELVFDREPLSRVFGQLEQRFSTSFSYDQQTLVTLSFTGTIQTKDSLDKVLDRIAFLNDLTITKTSRGYNISIKQ